MGLAGCQTVTVRAPAGTVVKVDDKEHEVADGERDIEVAPGFAPVPYEVFRADGKAPRYEGTIERSEFSVWWAVGALALTACTLPTCVLCAVSVANPGLFVAPVFAVTSVSFAPISAIILAPSWFTLPLVGAGTVAGAQPLWLLGFAERLPDQVELTAEGAVPLAPDERGRRGPASATGVRF